MCGPDEFPDRSTIAYVVIDTREGYMPFSTLRAAVEEWHGTRSLRRVVALTDDERDQAHAFSESKKARS